ncbi:MAG: 3D domain-containing protein [Verrucomicrobia bacterium]|nr:3D domain-containing protein [Verrucomicrobiota bacterium]
MGTKKRFKLMLLLVALTMAGCYARDVRWTPIRPLSREKPREFVLLTTGYCPCGECCGWRRNWLGRPVISSGPRRGERKHVGITASNTRAKPGTIAADTRHFPFGTVMYVPGYGYGVVEDIGSSIKGYHIDLFFRSHSDAKEWGKKKKGVKVWMP